MKILFLYIYPHFAHAKMAEALHADFYPASKVSSESNIITGGLSVLKSVFSIPKNYDVYFCEGTYIIPALAKKLGLLNKNAKIINILATLLLYYIKIGKIRGLKKHLAIWLLREVDLFIPVSKMEDEILKEFLPDAKSIVVYPKPKKEIAEDLIKDKKMPALNSHKILSIGSFSAFYKGMDLVYSAFKMVRKKIPDTELFIVGEIPDLSKYVNCTEEGIHCLGYVDDKTFKKIIKDSAVYVHMGRGDAFSLSTVEAMLGGLPVIVSEWTGAKEIVKRVNKKLIVKLDAKDLAESIKWYFSLSNKDRYNLSQMIKKEAIKFFKNNNLKNFRKRVMKAIRTS